MYNKLSLNLPMRRSGKRKQERLKKAALRLNEKHTDEAIA
jgi:hypothetical protein